MDTLPNCPDISALRTIVMGGVCQLSGGLLPQLWVWFGVMLNYAGEYGEYCNAGDA